MSKKTYTLEQIMSAWSKYKTPVYYYNGEEKSRDEYQGILGKKHIMESSNTFLKIVDRYKDLHISFPEYLAELSENK